MKKDWITLFDGKEYEFLSNFYPCSIEYEGLVYPTTEHAFQAAKTHDKIKRELIANCATPGDAKRMGRKVELRGDWEEVKDSVMLKVLRIKFKDEKLRGKLLATGNAMLIEDTRWHDNWWGVCNCEKCPGVGKNMLGTLLMQVRQEIRNEVRTEDTVKAGCPICGSSCPFGTGEDPCNGA